MNRESNRLEPLGSDDISDAELTQKAQKGDADAFDTLICRHRKAIYNLVYRMVGGNPQEADETAHEVFLSAFRSIRGFRGKSTFYTWLYRIAINHAKTRRARLANEGKLFIQMSESSDFVPEIIDTMDPEQIVAKKEFWNHLQAALNRLSAEHLEILILVTVNGASYEDAAEILGIPINTVKSRLNRARESLAKECAPLLKEWSWL